MRSINGRAAKEHIGIVVVWVVDHILGRSQVRSASPAPQFAITHATNPPIVRYTVGGFCCAKLTSSVFEERIGHLLLHSVMFNRAGKLHAE